jgi:membrane fusion protein (multidrug efflux system)
MNAMAKAETGKAEKIEMTADEAAQPPVPPQATAVAAPRKRSWLRPVLMVTVPLILAVGGGYYWVTGGRYQETDNANLRQAKVTIAADTAGRVIETHVEENSQVKSGDVLFVVDPEPYRIALEQADAALASARLNVEQLRSAYSQAVAQEQVSAGDVTYFRSELERQSTLADKGVGTRSAYDAARRDLTKAEDEQRAAQEAIAGALAALGGKADVETDRHPAVLAAQAARDQAAWSLGQTTVRAPADGIVSQASSFKSGQFVAAGTPLFSLVETQDSWIEANFKETQLTNMRPGQDAEVEIDTYPGRPFKATVEAIGAGTGAEFSLLPAQNATGNWVKVTQRIPVRVKVDADGTDLALRTGMSATVTVDTGKSRGLPDVSGMVAGLFGTASAAQ